MKKILTQKKNNSAIILLSGGLDSLVALGYVKSRNEYDIKLALTFDYGQKALANELVASQKICDHYNIELQVIKLEWLKNITKSSLIGSQEIPDKNFSTKSSAKAVWVPNRNALFLNIAACYCDANKYKYIIYGANKEEGTNFPDNTNEFRTKISDLFSVSTLYHPSVTAPLINCNKDDIVRIALECNVPLDLVWSCYKAGKKHCGKCESCYYLKKALLANKCDKYVGLLFEDEN